jgi:hypothetical protein
VNDASEAIARFPQVNIDYNTSIGKILHFLFNKIGTNMKFYYFSDEEQEEQCEGRLSSTVL